MMPYVSLSLELISGPEIEYGFGELNPSICGVRLVGPSFLEFFFSFFLLL